MKSFPVLVLVFGVLLSVGLIGCGGGGGGGSPTGPAPAAAAITQTLNSFVKAMANGRITEATKLMSSRMAAVGANTALTVWDFGDDIDDPSDDQQYTFYIPSDGILQYSDDYAQVYAEYNSPEGTLVALNFVLLREEGVWYIDDIEVTSSSTQAYALASWLQMNPGNTWNYSIKYGNDLPSTYSVRYTVGPAKTLSYTVSDPASRIVAQSNAKAGIRAATVSVTGYSLIPEALDSSGAVVPMAAVAGTARQDDPAYRMPWNTAFAPETFANTSGLQYFGITDSESSFNSGVPWQVIPPLAEVGETLNQTLTYGANTYLATTTIGAWTKVGDVDVIPVTIQITRSGDPVVPGATIYLNQNFGIVKYSIPTTTGTYEEILSSVTINGTTATPTTTASPSSPVVPTATPTMDVQARQISPTVLQVSFYDTGVPISPDSGSAVNTANYVLYEQQKLKSGGALASLTHVPQSASLNTSGAINVVDLTFSGIDLRHTRLQLVAQDVYSSDRTKITATPPIDLEDHVKFYSFRPWSAVGGSGYAKRIVRPSTSAANGDLFLVYDNSIQVVTMSEALVGGEKVLNFSSPTTFSTAFSAGDTFCDAALAQDSSGSELGYWVTGNDTLNNPFIAFLNQSGGGLVKQGLDFLPGRATLGRGYTFTTNGQTHVVVADDTGVVQSYRWNGASALTFGGSITPAGPGSAIVDMQSYLNGGTSQLWIWAQSPSPLDDLIRYDLSDTGVISSVVTSRSNWTGLTDPGSMHWMINNESAGLVNSLLYVSGVAGNGKLGQVDLSSDPVTPSPTLIVDSASAGPGPDYEGGIKNLGTAPIGNAASIEVFKYSDNNGSAEKDYWIIVGDDDGLSVYRYK